MEKIRSFIAVPLPPDLLKEARKIADRLGAISKGVKWVKPESMHLTLKFLGNLPKDEIEKVFSGMDQLFQLPHKSMKLCSNELGAFPSLKRPRVLWIGIQGEGLQDLLKLHSDIEESLFETGFPKEERRFSPHLTLARVKFADNLEKLLELYTKYEFPRVAFKVSEVNIMRSILKPTGAEYRIQKTYYLDQ